MSQGHTCVSASSCRLFTHPYMPVPCLSLFFTSPCCPSCTHPVPTCARASSRCPQAFWSRVMRSSFMAWNFFSSSLHVHTHERGADLSCLGVERTHAHIHTAHTHTYTQAKDLRDAHGVHSHPFYNCAPCTHPPTPTKECLCTCTHVHMLTQVHTSTHIHAHACTHA